MAYKIYKPSRKLYLCMKLNINMMQLPMILYSITQVNNFKITTQNRNDKGFQIFSSEENCIINYIYKKDQHIIENPNPKIKLG